MTGEQFQKRRERLGLTKVKLAELLDVNENAIWRWETGKVKIPRTVELALERIEEKIKAAIDNIE
jgi:transcriptional regulator with XRE-family HTH domain